MTSPNRQPRIVGMALRAAVGLGVLVLLGDYLLQKRALLAHAYRLEWVDLLVISAGIWLLVLVRAMQIRALLRALGTAAGLTHLMVLNLANGCLNHLPVRAGLAMGAVWLHRRCHLRYSKFFSLAVAAVGLGVVTSSGFGLVGLVGSSQMAAAPRAALFGVFGLGVVVPILLCFAPAPPRPIPSARARRGLRRFALGLRRIGRNRTALWQSLLAQAAQYVLRCARLYFVFTVCGFQIDLLGILVVQSLASFSTSVMTTPGGLGVREGAISVAAEWLGAGFDAGLLVAAVDRAVLLLWTIVLGLPAVFWLTQQLARTDARRRDAVPATA